MILPSLLAGTEHCKPTCDGAEGHFSAGQDWVAGQGREGDSFTPTLYTQSVARAAALSHTKQIITNEKGIWFERVYKAYDSKLPLCEGLGGFPDNPGKYGNKQD